MVARATYSTVLSLAQYVNICAVRFGLHSVVRTGGRFERSNSKHRTAFTACLGASNKHLGLGELAVARAPPPRPPPAPRAPARRNGCTARACRCRARSGLSFVM